jgi:hypothetical protein
MKLTDRIIYDPVPYAMRVLVVLVCAGLLLLAFGCASNRYLTAEEDATLRARCEPSGGCVAIPLPIWQQIEELLKSMVGV